MVILQQPVPQYTTTPSGIVLHKLVEDTSRNCTTIGPALKWLSLLTQKRTYAETHKTTTSTSITKTFSCFQFRYYIYVCIVQLPRNSTLLAHNIQYNVVIHLYQILFNSSILCIKHKSGQSLWAQYKKRPADTVSSKALYYYSKDYKVHSFLRIVVVVVVVLVVVVVVLESSALFHTSTSFLWGLEFWIESWVNFSHTPPKNVKNTTIAIYLQYTIVYYVPSSILVYEQQQQDQ